jgi:hypothetical protein
MRMAFMKRVRKGYPEYTELILTGGAAKQRFPLDAWVASHPLETQRFCIGLCFSLLL